MSHLFNKQAESREHRALKELGRRILEELGCSVIMEEMEWWIPQYYKDEKGVPREWPTNIPKRIDLVGIRNSQWIAIECGQCDADRIMRLKKEFDLVIHLPLSHTPDFFIHRTDVMRKQLVQVEDAKKKRRRRKRHIQGAYLGKRWFNYEALEKRSLPRRREVERGVWRDGILGICASVLHWLLTGFKVKNISSPSAIPTLLRISLVANISVDISLNSIELTSGIYGKTAKSTLGSE